MVRYEIRPTEGEYELWSLVKNPDDKWHGPDFIHENFVCGGSEAYCEEIKAKLEVL